MTSTENRTGSKEDLGETVPMIDVQEQNPEKSENKTELKEYSGETVPLTDVQVQKPEESGK